jgi:hypothetical protein
MDSQPLDEYRYWDGIRAQRRCSGVQLAHCDGVNRTDETPRRTMIPLLILFGGALVVLVVLVVFGDMLVNIGGQQVGIMERRYFGRGLPEGRVVALRGEVGFQAGVLSPGLHVLVPFLFRVQKTPMIVVGEEEVGLVESIDGLPLDPGRIFARRVTGHDSFQDGEAFIRNAGQKGPQTDILPPGQYRINTYLFRVRIESALIVAANNIGIVTARDGVAMEPGRLLARRSMATSRSRTARPSSPLAGSAPANRVLGRYRQHRHVRRRDPPATVVQANWWACDGEGWRPCPWANWSP